MSDSQTYEEISRPITSEELELTNKLAEVNEQLRVANEMIELFKSAEGKILRVDQLVIQADTVELKPMTLNNTNNIEVVPQVNLAPEIKVQPAEVKVNNQPVVVPPAKVEVVTEKPEVMNNTRIINKTSDKQIEFVYDKKGEKIIGAKLVEPKEGRDGN